MKIYAIYYVDDSDYDCVMRREDALNCGVGYIRQIGEEESWDPQEIESLVDEFICRGWAYNLCSLEDIYVKE